MYIETSPIVFISHIIIVPTHMIDSEKISNLCNQIWLCNRSLDDEALQLENGRRPCDVAQSYTGASSDNMTIWLVQSAPSLVSQGGESLQVTYPVTTK